MQADSQLKHLAVIMDGNGRWAKKHKHKRIFGHVKGAKTTRELIQYCSRMKLPYLSIFALSTENVSRPQSEIQNLKKLLEKIFSTHSEFLKKEKVRLHILGDLSIFSEKLQNLCQKLCEETKNYKGLNLIVALNYGGRQEIVKAMKKAGTELEQGHLKSGDLNEKNLSSFFCSHPFPPPDLIIRTGGQNRLSNFYLWSSAYSELYFTDTLWPDFDKKCLLKALDKFHSVQRRFGRI